jgi:glutamyl-tRNA reductase
VTSLGTRRHIVTREKVKAALKARRHRPLVLVDLGIPGDIDPSVEQLDDAFLFDLDDLEQVAIKGRATREKEAASALRLLEEEVAAFLRIRAERQAVPALMELRAYFEAARDAALADAGGDPEKATRLLVNRLLHNPSEALRDLAGQGTGGVGNLREMERALNRLFGLGRGPEENE